MTANDAAPAAAKTAPSRGALGDGNDSLADHCPFPEEHLSGLLDGALTRVEAGRVRAHLEECGRCRELYQEFEDLRATAIATDFPVPHDDQWDETPRSGISRWVRNLGWVLSALVIVAWLGLLVSPLESPAIETAFRWLGRGAVAAVVCLFVSALLDRRQVARGDLYKGVHK